MGSDRIPYLERITTDPAILGGKPAVKGTRISVETVLAHLADTLDLDDLFQAYPRLTVADVQACLAYAEALVAGEADAAAFRAAAGSWREHLDPATFKRERRELQRDDAPRRML